MEINNKIKEIEKGCGKEFMWIGFLKDKRICGQIEDLKHSDNIILCPICKEKLELLKQFQNTLKNLKEELKENIKVESWNEHKILSFIDKTFDKHSGEIK